MFSVLGYLLAATSASTTALGAYNLGKLLARRAVVRIRDRIQRNKIEAQQATITDYIMKVSSEVSGVLPELAAIRNQFKSGDKKAAIKSALEQIEDYLNDDEAAAA